jgi:hypothetical protein
MAARPPQKTSREGEQTAFGIAVVDEYLADADLDYPAAADDVVDALGDQRVRCGPNSHEIALSTALDRTDRRRFDSRQDLLDELHEAFERERRSTSSLVAKLKVLLGA